MHDICTGLIHTYSKHFIWYEINWTYTTHIPVMVRAGRLTGKIIHRDISGTRSSTAPLKKSTSFAFASLSPSAHQCAFILVAWPQIGLSQISYLWRKRNNLYHDNNNSMMNRLAFYIWLHNAYLFGILHYSSHIFLLVYTYLHMHIVFFHLFKHSQCISVILSILFSVPVETTEHFNACKYCSVPNWCVFVSKFDSKSRFKSMQKNILLVTSQNGRLKLQFNLSVIIAVCVV